MEHKTARLDLKFYVAADYANQNDALLIGEYVATLRGGAIA